MEWNYREGHFPDGADLSDLIEIALVVGVGVTLQDVLESPEYVEKRQFFQDGLVDDDEQTHIKTILHAGVHAVGAALSGYSGVRSTLKELRDQQPLPETNPDERALIELLGDMLLTRASENIPEKLREEMAGFNDLSLPQQLDKIGLIMGTFDHAKWGEDDDFEVADLDGLGAQYEAGDESVKQTVMNNLIDQLDLDDIFNANFADAEAPVSSWRVVLPNLTGAWEKGYRRPNCLGVAILVASMFRGENVPLLFVNQIKSRNHFNWEHYGYHYADIAEIVRELGIVLPDEVGQKIETNVDIYNDELSQVGGDQYHHSVVIKMADGSWYQVDPYQRAEGVIDSGPFLDSVHEMLGFYKAPYPGLTVTRGFEGEIAQYEKTRGLEPEKQALFASAKELSLLLSQLTADGAELDYHMVHEWVTLAADIIHQNIQRFQVEGYWGVDFTDIVLSDIMSWGGFGKVDYAGKAANRKSRQAAFQQRCNKDPAYVYRRLEDVVSYPIRLFMRDVRKKMKYYADTYADSTIEVANPEYMTALMVLNHLRGTRKDVKIGVGERLFQHTSSQLVAVDLLLQRESADPALVKRAYRLVRQMPEMLRHVRGEVLLSTEGESNDPSPVGNGGSRTNRPAESFEGER